MKHTATETTSHHRPHARFILAASAAVLAWLPFTTPVQAGWLPVTGTNTWQTTTNWAGGTIDGLFNQVSMGDQFVELSGNTSIASLQFLYDGAANLTLQSNSTTNSRVLTLTNGITVDTVADGRSVSIGSSATTNRFVRLALGGSIQDFTVAGTDELVVFNSITNSTTVGIGDGGINKLGSGTLRMEGTAGSYTLGTTVNAGTLAVGANLALGTGPVTLNGGRIVASGGSRTLANNFVINGDAAIGGGSSFFLIGINGTTSLGSALRTITVDNTTSFGGIVSGTGGLSLTTAGATARTINFTAANDYTGGATIGGAATLALGTAGSIADSNAVTLSSATAVLSISAITATSETIGSLAGVANSSVALGGKTLVVGADTTSTDFAGILSGTGGSLTKIGGGVQTLSGANTYTGPTSILAGTLRVTSTGLLGAAPGAPTPGSIVINGGALQTTSTVTLNVNRGIALGPDTGSGSGTVNVDPATVLTYDGVVANNGSGTGRLIKTGDGSLRLNGTNTYTGGVSILAGTLSIGSDLRLGAVPASPAPGSVVINGGTLLSTFTLTLSTNRGIVLGPDTGSGSGTVSVSSGTTLTSGAPITNNGAGTGRLIKTGTGTLRLQTSPNTFTGGVSILAGTLRIALDSRLGATPGAVTPGNLLIFTGASLTLDPLSPLTINANRGIAIGPDTGSGSGTIDVSPADLANSVTYGGVIADNAAGSGGLIKAGAGLLTLTGVNTYTGPTQVTAGTLAISGSINASSSVNVNGGTLLLGASNVIKNDASVTLSSGTLQTAGNSESSATAPGLGASIIENTSTIDFGSGSSTLWFSGLTSISGTLNIENWSGSGAGGGADQLRFSSDPGALLGQISFAGVSGAAEVFFANGGNSYYEVVPIPEPSSTALIGATGLLALIGCRERRRWLPAFRGPRSARAV